MRVTAIVCNIIMCVLTSLVVISEGVSNELIYQGFTLFMLLVPIMSTFILIKSVMPRSTKLFKSSAYLVATILNILMVAFLVLAMVDQYPHPKEDGFITYVIIVAITPIINTFVLYRLFKGTRLSNEKSASISDDLRDA